MFFLFSGEGTTDLGCCTNSGSHCRDRDYSHGPMAVVVGQIVESRHGYSPIDTGFCGYVPKGTLAERAAELKTLRKPLSLPGKKTPKETRYFYNNARVLARIAKDFETLVDDEVVAVFFRDSDGSQSADRGLWDDKVASMYRGFDSEGFQRGVPMIPKPKSEAWVLCALKYGYHDGDLETRSGNDHSPNSLKSELLAHCGPLSAQDLVALVRKRAIDIDQLKMPSFMAFRVRLESVI
ncbi:hypothetical protein [Gimesia maris]|uniref:hypothetical protein n=1 Tax=Gimesia maris TaxID=122 RepID=UPI003A93B2CA